MDWEDVGEEDLVRLQPGWDGFVCFVSPEK